MAAFESLNERYADAVIRLDRYRKALEEIANMDYRGNRPHEATIAWKALHPDA